MNGPLLAIELAGFVEGDEGFRLFEFLSLQPEHCADSDLRILFDARLSREQVAEMLEHAAHRMRVGTTKICVDDVALLLSRIGAQQ